jgi:hypothetical protein
MGRIRLKHLSVSILVTLSMFVSAVSACACSHHQPAVAAESNSCHSASHHQPEAETAESGQSDSAGTSCACFLKTPAPVIITKAEARKAKSQSNAVNSVGNIDVERIEFHAFLLPESDLQRTNLYKSGEIASLKPSRAPPVP